MIFALINTRHYAWLTSTISQYQKNHRLYQTIAQTFVRAVWTWQFSTFYFFKKHYIQIYNIIVQFSKKPDLMVSKSLEYDSQSKWVSHMTLEPEQYISICTYHKLTATIHIWWLVASKMSVSDGLRYCCVGIRWFWIVIFSSLSTGTSYIISGLQ